MNLTKEEQEKFDANVIAYVGDEDALEWIINAKLIADEADQLKVAFLWCETPEGFDYWENIYDRLRGRGVKKLTEQINILEMSKGGADKPTPETDEKITNLLSDIIGFAIDKDRGDVFTPDVVDRVFNHIKNKHLPEMYMRMLGEDSKAASCLAELVTENNYLPNFKISYTYTKESDDFKLESVTFDPKKLT